MRKLVAVLAGGLLGLGFLALMASPADAELKTSISGSIRMMGHYTDVIANNGAQEEVAPTTLPYTNGPGKNREADNQQTMLDARRTRLQLDMSDMVGSIKISGRWQGDFDTGDGNANTSNSRHLRMRLGWGQWQTPGGWIVRFGQSRGTMSEYGDNLFGGVADGDTVDENGEWDQLQNRSPLVQVGWTTKMMGGDLLVGVGVEKSSTSVLDRTSSTTLACVTSAGSITIQTAACPSGSTTFTDGTTTSLASTANVDLSQGTGQDLPMFAAAARWRSPLFAVFLRGATQNNKVIYSASSPGQKQGDSTYYQGWLTAIGAEVTPGPLRIYGQYYYADGLNRLGGSYNDVAMQGGGFQGQSGLGPANSRIHLVGIQTHNWHAGAAYKLTKDLKFEALYELQVAEANRKIFNLTATSTDKRDFQAVHANIIYSFWTRFDTGLEYQWGRVGSFGSSTGILNAVNMRLRLYF